MMRMRAVTLGKIAAVGVLLAASGARAQTEFVAYDNLSTLSNLGASYLSAIPNDFSVVVGGGGGVVTSLVADDIKAVGVTQPYRITEMSFYATNTNSSAVKVRPLLRLWNDDRFLEPIGEAPGTLLVAATLPEITLPAAPAGSFSSTLITYRFLPPAGVAIPQPSGPDKGRSEAFWAGVVFDNNGGRTGATLAQMNQVGLLINDVFNNTRPGDGVIIGNSGDVLWGTDNDPSSSYFGDPGTDAFARDNPPGDAFDVGNLPAAPGLDPPRANVAFRFLAINGAAAPEPGTFALFALGLAVTALPVIRRRKS